MQVTLWGVLAASVAVAALVDRQFAAPAVKLAAQQDKPPLHYRLPAGWEVANGSEDDPRIVALAADPATHRSLAIYLQHFRGPLLTPLDYLQDWGLIADIFGQSRPEQISPLAVGSVQGVRLIGRTTAQSEQGEYLESEMVVCFVYPNHRAVTLWLAKRGAWTQADYNLMNLVAASLKMDGVSQQ